MEDNQLNTQLKKLYQLNEQLKTDSFQGPRDLQLELLNELTLSIRKQLKLLSRNYSQNKIVSGVTTSLASASELSQFFSLKSQTSPSSSLDQKYRRILEFIENKSKVFSTILISNLETEDTQQDYIQQNLLGKILLESSRSRVLSQIEKLQGRVNLQNIVWLKEEAIFKNFFLLKFKQMKTKVVEEKLRDLKRRKLAEENNELYQEESESEAPNDEEFFLCEYETKMADLVYLIVASAEEQLQELINTIKAQAQEGKSLKKGQKQSLLGADLLIELVFQINSIIDFDQLDQSKGFFYLNKGGDSFQQLKEQEALKQAQIDKPKGLIGYIPFSERSQGTQSHKQEYLGMKRANKYSLSEFNDEQQKNLDTKNQFQEEEAFAAQYFEIKEMIKVKLQNMFLLVLSELKSEEDIKTLLNKLNVTVYDKLENPLIFGDLISRLFDPDTFYSQDIKELALSHLIPLISKYGLQYERLYHSLYKMLQDDQPLTPKMLKMIEICLRVNTLPGRQQHIFLKLLLRKSMSSEAHQIIWFLGLLVNLVKKNQGLKTFLVAAEGLRDEFNLAQDYEEMLQGQTEKGVKEQNELNVEEALNAKEKQLSFKPFELLSLKSHYLPQISQIVDSLNEDLEKIDFIELNQFQNLSYDKLINRQLQAFKESFQ